MHWKYITVALFIGLHVAIASAFELITPYKYTLMAENHLLAGRIPKDALKGDRIRAETENEGHSEEGHKHKVVYLKVSWTENRGAKQGLQTTRGDILMPSVDPDETKATNPGDPTPSVTHHGSHTLALSSSGQARKSTSGSGYSSSSVSFPNTGVLVSGTASTMINIPDATEEDFDITSGVQTSLPAQGASTAQTAHDEPQAERLAQQQPEFAIAETNAFRVNRENYIVVNDTSSFAEHAFIEFYLYMTDEHGAIVSNPLPFIVYIDHGEDSGSYPTVPAVFAGVLVLCVVFLALFIPLVTRAKRRYKQGKPMFKLGSHPSTNELAVSNIPRKQSEPNWYGNNAFFNYEEEVEREKNDFTRGLRQYSVKSEPPRQKEPLSEKSSSSGVDVASQSGAEGTPGDSYSQKL